MNAWINLSISKDKRFSVKKMDTYKALNSDTSLGDEIFFNPMQTKQ